MKLYNRFDNTIEFSVDNALKSVGNSIMHPIDTAHKLSAGAHLLSAKNKAAKGDWRGAINQLGKTAQSGLKTNKAQSVINKPGSLVGSAVKNVTNGFLGNKGSNKLANNLSGKINGAINSVASNTVNKVAKTVTQMHSELDNYQLALYRHSMNDDKEYDKDKNSVNFTPSYLLIRSGGSKVVKGPFNNELDLNKVKLEALTLGNDVDVYTDKSELDRIMSVHENKTPNVSILTQSVTRGPGGDIIDQGESSTLSFSDTGVKVKYDDEGFPIPETMKDLSTLTQGPVDFYVVKSMKDKDFVGPFTEGKAHEFYKSIEGKNKDQMIRIIRGKKDLDRYLNGEDIDKEFDLIEYLAN